MRGPLGGKSPICYGISTRYSSPASTPYPRQQMCTQICVPHMRQEITCDFQEVPFLLAQLIAKLLLVPGVYIDFILLILKSLKK
jgi:hypothetical protein